MTNPVDIASVSNARPHAAMRNDNEVVFEIKELHVEFRTGQGTAEAVNGMSMKVRRGERVAIVGESGCGKTATLLASMRLLPTPPARTTAGEVLLDGQDLLAMSPAKLRRVIGKDISMIFQDSLSAFNPVARIGKQISEGARKHQGLSRRAARKHAVALLERVGIPDPEARVNQYPHEMSGGMRQRAMIAMALASEPKVLLADEPTTALDVTIQAQILDLVRSFTDLALVWVSHDLGVVAGLAERVIVMYAGSVVEEGPVRDIFHDARHPYTRGLLSSVPRIRASERPRLTAIPGLPPVLTDLPKGCPFYDRCPDRIDKCVSEKPPLTTFADGRTAACWVTVEGESA